MGGTDAISWEVMLCVRLTLEDTTSSSRIFIKILFQELTENLGLKKISERSGDPICARWLVNIFPMDTSANVRFSINFFTSIGLGGLTNAQREYLKCLPQRIMEKHAEDFAQSLTNKEEKKTNILPSSEEESYSNSSNSD